MSRSLRTRLQEYADSLRETSSALTGLAGRAPATPETDALRELAKIQGLLSDDLHKILRGEELQAYMITVEVPDGH